MEKPNNLENELLNLIKTKGLDDSEFEILMNSELNSLNQREYREISKKAKIIEGRIERKVNFLYGILTDLRQGKYASKSVNDLLMLRERLEQDVDKTNFGLALKDYQLGELNKTYFEQYFDFQNLISGELNVQIDRQIRGE